MQQNTIIQIYKMGNQSCKDCKHELHESLAYGSYQVHIQDNQQYAVIEKKVEKVDSNIQKNILSQLQIRKNINNVHIVKLSKFDMKKQPDGIKVIMFYQYVSKTLRQRVQEIKDKGHIFTQRQIFSLIYSVESALQQLYKNKIKHCCLNLDTILLRNNTYKISDMSALTYVTSYSAVARGNRQQFLSQNLLQKLKHGSLYPKYSSDDDYFSLGMIVLVIASGKQAKQFYQWNQKGHGDLNSRAIDQALKVMNRRYTQKLVKKTKQLLLFDKDSQSLDKTINMNLTNRLKDFEEQHSKVSQKLGKTLNSTNVSQNYSRIQI